MAEPSTAVPGEREIAAEWHRRRTRQSWVIVAILVVAGVFDAISGNPVDALLLIGVGILLGVLPGNPEPGRTREPSMRSRSQLVIASGAGTVAFAAVVGTFKRHSWPMTAAILVPGIGALALAWSGSRQRRPGPPLRLPQVLPWIAVAVSLGIFELVNLLLQPGLTIDSYDHPTLSVLWDGASGGLGDSIGLLVWITLGIYLVDR